MHWLILCNDCCERLDPDDLIGVFEAKFGPIEDKNAEGAVLACAPWGERVQDNATVWQFFCDDCGAAVAVAESSQWFIDSHRRERDEQIERA